MYTGVITCIDNLGTVALGDPGNRPSAAWKRGPQAALESALMRLAF